MILDKKVQPQIVFLSSLFFLIIKRRERNFYAEFVAHHHPSSNSAMRHHAVFGMEFPHAFLVCGSGEFAKHPGAPHGRGVLNCECGSACAAAAQFKAKV